MHRNNSTGFFPLHSEAHASKTSFFKDLFKSIIGPMWIFNIVCYIHWHARREVSFVSTYDIHWESSQTSRFLAPPRVIQVCTRRLSSIQIINSLRSNSSARPFGPRCRHSKCWWLPIFPVVILSCGYESELRLRERVKSQVGVAQLVLGVMAAKPG